MQAITHLTFNYCVAKLANFQDTQLFLVTVSALIPDIDHSGSFLGRFLRLRWFRHRGFTHSLAATLLLGLFAPFPIVLGYFLGWFLDMFTVAGVQIFWPLPDRWAIFPGLRITTGSRKESLFCFFLIFLALVLTITPPDPSLAIAGLTRQLLLVNHQALGVEATCLLPWGQLVHLKGLAIGNLEGGLVVVPDRLILGYREGHCRPERIRYTRDSRRIERRSAQVLRKGCYYWGSAVLLGGGQLLERPPFLEIRGDSVRFRYASAEEVAEVLDFADYVSLISVCLRG
ncbi:MAG: hypothetical protein D6750_08535 [Bacteroidetes bacterium]|jgi:membrane-bound metal-dependent hydrolase YbcI (DUF457 family)|nr:MAG: hypothetical protein D6750_08535 [Bacteroidota bacterium]